MDATGARAFRGVSVEEATHLAHDLLPRARLVATLRRVRVAMHRVGDPDHVAALALDRAQEWRQPVDNAVRAHARDDCEAAGLVVRIEDVDETQKLRRIHGRAGLDGDRVGDSTGDCVESNKQTRKIQGVDEMVSK